MIDVEVMLMGNENQAWYTDCKAGLNSPFVNLIESQGIKGHLNAGRMAAWDKGTNDLISWVDPDDIPDVDIWLKLKTIMDQNPNLSGCYSLESTINQDGNIISVQHDTSGVDPVVSPMVAHHVVVVRRSIYELVRPYAQQFNCGIDWLLTTAAYHRGGLKCLTDIGYQWRRHPNNASSTTFTYPRNLAGDFLTWMKQQK